MQNTFILSVNQLFNIKRIISKTQDMLNPEPLYNKIQKYILLSYSIKKVIMEQGYSKEVNRGIA